MRGRVFLIHPNGRSRTIRKGFCWVGFLLPQVWSLVHGYWRPWAISGLPFAIGRVSEGVTEYCRLHSYLGNFSCLDIALSLALLPPVMQLTLMIVFGLYGQQWMVSDLLKHGYRDNTPFDTDTQACRSM